MNLFKTVISRDPAARNFIEVLLLYPSVHVMVAYRIAHFLWRLRFKLLARFISQIARILTGIEIHPAAKIGKGFFIDHGMGVVIGATAEIGDDVTLYHGVTLGGVSPAINSDEQRLVKRHPTLSDGVIVGANAQILGAVTIGKNVRVGSATLVTKDVPDNVTIVGNPGRVVKKKCTEKFSAYGIPDGQLPDTIARVLDEMQAEIDHLQAQFTQISDKTQSKVTRKVAGKPAGKDTKDKKNKAGV